MNKYEIIGIVGEGAYGVVYKAKCKETGDFGKYHIKTFPWLSSPHHKFCFYLNFQLFVCSLLCIYHSCIFGQFNI